jgi:hypothetical protein
MKEQKSISPQRYRKNGMLRNLETELNLKEKEYFTTEDTENTKKKVSANRIKILFSFTSVSFVLSVVNDLSLHS